MITVALVSAGTDGLFCGFAFYICAHFKIISHKFRLVISRKPGSVKEFCTKVAPAINYHNKLYDICTELNRIFYPVILSQFFISSIQLCVIGYQIILVSGRFNDFAS